MSLRSDVAKLIELRNAAGEPMTASFVVESARDAAAYPDLNRHLWQVPEADLAAEARLQRAHRLLITMTVTVAETGDTTRMMVHTPGSPGYQSIEYVAKTPDIVVAKLRQLGEEIGRARARLRAFRAAISADVAAEIDDLLKEAEGKTADAASSEVSLV